MQRVYLRIEFNPLNFDDDVTLKFIGILIFMYTV